MSIGDGSTTTSYFQTQQFDSSKELKDHASYFLEGQIIQIHYVDDKTNRSKSRVEYDVQARKADGSSSTYKNVVSLGDMQSTNDFRETVLEANEHAFQKELSKSNIPINMNGTRVVIAFLDGNLDKPIIVGGLGHERVPGAKKEDGIRKVSEYRGIRQEINKDGEYIFTYKSPNKPDGEATRPDTAPTVFKVDKEGNFIFAQEDPEGGTELNFLKYDRTNQKKEESVGKDLAISTIQDGAAESTTVSYKSGLKITEDGAGDKVSIEMAGGMSAIYDGTADTITFTTAGGATVTIDGAGNIKLDAGGTIVDVDGSGGKISLTGGLVDVGEAASAFAALGPQLISWLTTHTHTTTAPGSPTSPPNVPPPATLLSQTVKIKE